MSHCLCCQGNLLRHVRHSGIYWFCPACRQEMPEIVPEIQDQQSSRYFSEIGVCHHPVAPLS